MHAFLTFDDGPQIGSDEVLDVLANAGVNGSFFVTGQNKDSAGGENEQRRMFRRMMNEGHLVANHCLSHAIQTKAQYETAYGDLTLPAKKAAFDANLNDNEAYFQGLVVPNIVDFKHARLPGDGRTFPHLVAEVASLGLKHHSWSFEFAPNGAFAWVPSKNWQGVQGVAGTLSTVPGSGTVILLHDRHWKGGNKVLLANLVVKLKEHFELRLLS